MIGAPQVKTDIIRELMTSKEDAGVDTLNENKKKTRLTYTHTRLLGGANLQKKIDYKGKYSSNESLSNLVQ